MSGSYTRTGPYGRTNEMPMPERGQQRFFVVTNWIPQSPPPGAADFGRTALEAHSTGEADWADSVDTFMDPEQVAAMNVRIDALHQKLKVRRQLGLAGTTPFAEDLVHSEASNAMDELARGDAGQRLNTITPASARTAADRATTREFVSDAANRAFAWGMYDTAADVMLDPDGVIRKRAEKTFKPALARVAERFENAPPGDPERIAEMDKVRMPFAEFERSIVVPQLVAIYGTGHVIETFGHNITVGGPDITLVTKHFPQ